MATSAERLARRRNRGIRDAHSVAGVGRAVDLVIAECAPVDLVRRVLRDGVLLLERNRSARIRFEMDARSRYFDMLPVWRITRREGVA